MIIEHGHVRHLYRGRLPDVDMVTAWYKVGDIYKVLQYHPPGSHKDAPARYGHYHVRKVAKNEDGSAHVDANNSVDGAKDHFYIFGEENLEYGEQFAAAAAAAAAAR